jgi:CDP-glycerol glycerophosphotransferase (TagB/SpsB family)
VVRPLEAKEQVHTLLHEPFFYENRVRLGQPSGKLTAEIGTEQFPISVCGRSAQQEIDLAAMFAAVVAPTRSPTAISWRAARVRRLSQSPAVKRRFANAWVLMDRDIQADDNAEHLYRFIRRTRDDINAFFVLRRDSRDWRRLEAEGFRLIPFGSIEHQCALLNARFLISSHADSYIWRYLPPAQYRDLISYKFIFLQHGVLFHDLASWMNTIPIDLMIASGERERDAVAGHSNRYKLMPSQVALTGMPRHDALIRSGSRPERHILLMPTWRNSLVGRRLGQGTERELNDAFAETEFARAWKAVLHAPRLKSLMERHGYRITFFPHTNVEPYVPWFDVPPSIEVRTRASGASIQEAFRSARLLITDYSSVAFEMALLGRGTLYYQFDRARIFTGIHSIREGFFKYERDGFGPLCPDLDTLLDQLECALANGGEVDAIYAQRMREPFAWRDGNACRRTVQAIERLGLQVAAQPSLQPSTIETGAGEPELLLSHARTLR